MIVAIDGPAGVGKSTVARRAAQMVGFRYLNSGSFYRAVTLAVLDRGTPPTDTDAVLGTARGSRLDVVDGAVHLNGRCVEDQLHGDRVDAWVAAHSAIPGVRDVVNRRLRELCAGNDVVVEGRDIGTVVFPDADVKIYLDADPKERVRRRLMEVRAKGEEIAEAALAEQMKERDRRDSGRADSPLAQAPDAAYVDSTPLTIEEVEEKILQIVRARVTNGKEFR